VGRRCWNAGKHESGLEYSSTPTLQRSCVLAVDLEILEDHEQISPPVRRDQFSSGIFPHIKAVKNRVGARKRHPEIMEGGDVNSDEPFWKGRLKTVPVVRETRHFGTTNG